jgi:hypothetical protein
MSRRRSQHPQIELLETIALLSGGASDLHAPGHDKAAVVVLPSVPVITPRMPISLLGMAKGDYTARTIPDAGKFYTFTRGSGAIEPLGPVKVTGNVSLPGLLIMPVPVGGGIPLATPPMASGQLTLATAMGRQGSVVLALSAPSHDNAMTLPAVFSYQITKATGVFRGDTGTGSVVIRVKPLDPTPVPGPVILPGGLERGTFTMNFLPPVPAP